MLFLLGMRMLRDKRKKAALLANIMIAFSVAPHTTVDPDSASRTNWRQPT